MTRSWNDIRREVRARRRLVTATERAAASRQFARLADQAHLLRPGQHIAVYHPFGHEADVSRLTRRALRRGCVVYLPVITLERRGRMQFVRYARGAPLRLNAFGIAEPASPQRARPALQLDLVFVPLIAFDAHGSRLGSGAGFYDRTLQRLRSPRLWRRPRLIGIAYECQRVRGLASRPWDVPMDAVITEARLYRFSPPFNQMHRTG